MVNNLDSEKSLLDTTTFLKSEASVFHSEAVVVEKEARWAAFWNFSKCCIIIFVIIFILIVVGVLVLL